MSWLFSRALGVESWEESCSGGEQSAQSSATPTPQAYWSPGKTTDTCYRFRSGMTCEHLTADRGADVLTSFRAAFPARTSASPARAAASTPSDPASGGKCTASSPRRFRAGSSPKTLQPFALADWKTCSGRSLRSGTMRSGTVYPLPPLALPTAGTASGSWPTPTASLPTSPIAPWKEGVIWWKQSRAARHLGAIVQHPERLWPTPHGMCSPNKRRAGPSGNELGRAVNLSLWPTPTANRRDGLQSHGVNVVSGSLNPTWVEWLMGWPLGWTDLQPSATDKYRNARRKPGDF